MGTAIWTFDEGIAAVLAELVVPVWAIDRDVRFVWMNQPALDLWRSPSVEELNSRDFSTSARASTVLDGLFARAAKGERQQIEWTFYPRGEPVTLALDLRPIRFADGGLGLLNQALPSEGAFSDKARRNLTIADHSSVARVFAAADGEVLTMNPAAIHSLGERSSWIGCVVEDGLGEAILSRALAGESVRLSTRVHSSAGPSWQVVEAERLRDPVSGELGVLIELSDDTARVEAEQRARELHATLELVERQRAEILALSAPILDVGDRTLAVPLVGSLGADKGEMITGRLLEAVNQRGVRHVILDVTGVELMGDDGLGRLVAMVRALRLLGADATLTGIRPEMASELSRSSAELEGVATSRSLADGLRRLRVHAR